METTFKLSSERSLIIYDLEKNDVSAMEIAKQSDFLYSGIKFKGEDSYSLPFSTLKANLGRDKAIKEFKNAFSKSGSKSKISRLLVCEIKDKDGYIFEDK